MANSVVKRLANGVVAINNPRPGRVRQLLSKYWLHYIFILPGIVLLFLFAYLPMAGLLIAFQNYKLRPGLAGFFTGKWVGLANFWFLQDKYFWITLVNTVQITVFRMLVTWPLPIIMALSLNEMRQLKLRRAIQTVTYLPHFISWVIAGYMVTQVLALDTGIVNMVFRSFGLEQVLFLGEPQYFRGIVILQSAWKGVGFGTIIYLAALSNVDVSLQEAAMIDGAGRFQRIWHIDLPYIRPTIVLLLILSMPGLMSAGYDQIFPLQNPSNMAVSDILDIYVVRLGFVQAQYSLSTAIGLFVSLINLGLVLGANKAAKILGYEGLF